MPGQSIQAVERLAHTGWVAVQEDTDLTSGEEHQCLVMVSSIPPPRSIRTSMGACAGCVFVVLSLMAPRSMKEVGRFCRHGAGLMLATQSIAPDTEVTLRDSLIEAED